MSDIRPEDEGEDTAEHPAVEGEEATADTEGMGDGPVG